MKEKLTLRNVILWSIALFVLLLFFFTFGVGAKLVGPVDSSMYIDMRIRGAIWGCWSMTGTVNGHYAGSVNSKPVVSVAALIGAILLLLSSGGLVAVSFLIKDEKLKKILIFVCAGVVFVGSILLFFASGAVWRFLVQNMHEEGMTEATIALVKQYYAGCRAYSVGGILLGILGILSAAGIVVSQLVIKDLKLIKSKEA